MNESNPSQGELIPTAAADDPSSSDAEFVALLDKDQGVVGVLLLCQYGCYTREDNAWRLLDPDDEADDFEQYGQAEVLPTAVEVYDTARAKGKCPSLTEVVFHTGWAKWGQHEISKPDGWEMVDGRLTRSEKLVYGTVGGDLVFVEHGLAEELCAIHRGFLTWGDAQRTLSSSRWNAIMSSLDDAEITRPSDPDRCELDVVPGFADGDWPEWPAKLMLDWMPSDIAERYGHREDTTISGQYLAIDPKFEQEVVAAVEKNGWVCTKDEALVCQASGVASSTM